MESTNYEYTKERAAKIIRIITAPPFMIAVLILLLNKCTADIFLSSKDLAASLIGLVITPLLAYLAHRIIPPLYKTGRAGQRKTAFVFTIIGYTFCFIYGLFCGSPKLQFIFNVYFFTVIILAITNRFLKIRASGHSASAVSPCFFSGLYIGIPQCCAFLIVYALSIWSSLYLKRHNKNDIIAGICAFVLAAVISGIIYIV